MLTALHYKWAHNQNNLTDKINRSNINFTVLTFNVSIFFFQIMIAGLQVLGSMACTSVIRFLGRRKTSFLSMIVCILCLLLISAYIIVDVQISWMPLTLFGLLFFTAQLGISSILCTGPLGESLSQQVEEHT